MVKKKVTRKKKRSSYSTSTKITGSQSKEGPIKRADKIVNQRSEEQERRHGPFSAAMIKTAKIATELCKKEITAEDTYKILIALKLSRISHSIEIDSMTDLVGYAEGLWNFKNGR